MIGIIGQTQGVNKAAKPQSNPFRNISHNDALARSSSSLSAFSSLITGVQRMSLSTGSTLAVKTSEVLLSELSSDDGILMSTDVKSVVPEIDCEGATTAILFGRSLDENSKSTGNGGVHVRSSQA